jgi:hypothetical protein
LITNLPFSTFQFDEKGRLFFLYTVSKKFSPLMTQLLGTLEAKNDLSKPWFHEAGTGIIEQYAPNAEVWAFGPRVNGTARDHPDLDLVVIDGQKLPQKILSTTRSFSGIRTTD